MGTFPTSPLISEQNKHIKIPTHKAVLKAKYALRGNTFIFAHTIEAYLHVHSLFVRFLSLNNI